VVEDKRSIVNTSKLSRRWAAIIGLIIILGSEYILRDIFISKGSSAFQIGVVIAVEWIIALLLLFYWIPKVEHRKLDSIGFRKFRWKYIWISIVAYIVYFLISAGLEYGLKSAGLQGLRDLSPTLKGYGFPLLFGLFLTGTFVEELFYRGYIIERVTELSGRRWVAGIVSGLTFTLVHIRFFGLGPTLEVAIIAAVLVILYTRTRSIWPGIIVHGINDIFGFLIGPLFM
jgi:membrane protease YdiL (CAAX protease family)